MFFFPWNGSEVVCRAGSLRPLSQVCPLNPPTSTGTTSSNSKRRGAGAFAAGRITLGTKLGTRNHGGVLLWLDDMGHLQKHVYILL